ncbi:MAG TPA: lipopolysaccharide assembly protein LapA domain-containing protein [Gemmataceae bacterium]|nr:lipopolysaccharide assembly protein LapA domain-containing protein [Gemmataceae bacterium]
MRFLCLLFLVAFVAVLGYLAYENSQSVALNLFGFARDVPVPLLALALYVLGMLSGWFVVGMLKRSWKRMTETERR